MEHGNQSLPTIGILFPGEMGSCLGKVLSAEGFRVVTTLEGRSPRTRCLCQEAGLAVLDSVADVAREAEIVISVVPPDAALDVAERLIACVGDGPSPRLYIDANSIAPATVAAIQPLLEARGVDFLDAAIFGLASRLREQATLYLSGPAADEMESLLGRFLRVRVLGTTAGAASLMKMLLAGMAKGLVGLFLETSLISREAGLLDEYLEGIRHLYPGVMTAIERVLPTYPKHARRRAVEMRELERTVLSLGLRPGMAGETASLFEALAASGLGGCAQWEEPAAPSLPALIERIGRENLLRNRVTCSTEPLDEPQRTERNDYGIPTPIR